MIKKFLFFYLLLWSTLLFGQDPHISNIHTFRTYVNPAYLGFNDNLTTNIGHRRQWLYVPRALETTILSSNFYCDSKGLGAGLLALNNQEGEGYMTTNSISGIFAKNVFGLIKPKGSRNIVRFEMSAALQFGLSQKKIDWSELVFSDQLDPLKGISQPSSAQPQVESSPLIPDVGGGFIMRFSPFGGAYRKKALFKGPKDGNYSTLGVSFQHLNEPEESFLGGSAKLPTRWNIHGNFNLQNTNERATNVYSLNFLYQKQGKHTSLLAGPSFTTFGFLSMSLWWRGTFDEFRNSDAIIISTYTFLPIKNNELALGASYDMTIGPLSFARTRGSFELSLKFSFLDVGCPPSKKTSSRQDKRRKCPRPNSENMVMMKQNKTQAEQKKFMKKQKKKIYYFQNML